MRTSPFAAVLSIVVGVTIGGCAHDNPPTAAPPHPAPGTAVPEGVTNAQNSADLEVVDRIAAARCERAQVCNDIGAGKTYSTHELCRAQVRGDIANVLTAYNCPHGVDEAAVNRCIATINSRECGLSDAPVCSEALCLR